MLACGRCGSEFRVARGIPRFVDDGSYAASFGYQWNLFRTEQIDSVNGTKLSARRFFSETGWDADWMKGKWILDAGCGAGRFVDVAAGTGAHVVGLDVSSAIDAAAQTARGRRNVHLVQASIYDLPFKPGAFDGVYCIGVIQHTPDPDLALKSLPTPLKPGGRIALTAYERRRWWTRFHGKYLLRPLTRRANKGVLLRIIQGLMPVLFPLTEVLFRLPLVGRVFSFIIPVANYVNEPDLSLRQRYRWAVLDTFDMLSPAFDFPQTETDVRSALGSAGVGEISRRTDTGLNLIGIKMP
jgi:2-polyprenyl-3-methyl-5-hydroxy-6-metoxy-1,4-benzoquinol methylase